VSEDTLVMLGDGKCLVKSDDICKDGFGHSVVVGAGRLSWAPFYSFCSRLAWYQLAQHVWATFSVPMTKLLSEQATPYYSSTIIKCSFSNSSGNFHWPSDCPQTFSSVDGIFLLHNQNRLSSYFDQHLCHQRESSHVLRT